jgi:inward rectifier potassium channel
VKGFDDTSLQQVRGRYIWFAGAVAWGTRLADVVTETPGGDMVVDLRQFHEVVPHD